MAQAGDDRFFLDSAGTHGLHAGEAPDARTIAAAMRRGYSLSGLSARQVAPEDFERFDLLLGMDAGHVRQLRQRAPSQLKQKAVLFLEHAGVTHARDVPDPYYGTERDFEHTLDLIVEGCEALFARLARHAAEL